MDIIYQRIFEYTPDALLVIDQAGAIIMANVQAETQFGYDRSELIGQPVEMLIPQRFVAQHAHHRERFMSEANNRPMGAASELYSQRRDGSEFPVDIMLSPMIVEGGHFVLCVVRDITERKAATDKLRRQAEALKKLHAELADLANRDSLTGLLNRRAFHELAGQLLNTARRKQLCASLLMIDLDHFKQVNDLSGHAEGDHVLRQVAATLTATARKSDIVARHGGEEFVVLVLGNETESLVAAERLRSAIAGIGNLKNRITASIGVASTILDNPNEAVSRTLAAMLDRADQALYAAKRLGRNQSCHFSQVAPATSAASTCP